ncbi:unnamed protein product [Rhizophagus irregularis]|uniref:Uncharacterized protein n=1 Tax=Rhizophagus irregularis TaxID=588596 RepID=A0A915Z7L6_9GLOM|nr:unnamed protein product [Rhizophagus irregularis]
MIMKYTLIIQTIISGTNDEHIHENIPKRTSKEKEQLFNLFQKTTLFSEIITPPIQANDHLNENQKLFTNQIHFVESIPILLMLLEILENWKIDVGNLLKGSRNCKNNIDLIKPYWKYMIADLFSEINIHLN